MPIFVRGLGGVSPAGWGVEALRCACADRRELPITSLSRPGWARSLRARAVPQPGRRLGPLAHPRLRRTSPITQYAVAAAWEALGREPSVSAPASSPGQDSLGLVLCAMSGCVNYSRRFYDEVLSDPAAASPLVFPETVFNAPSSHLVAL